MKFIRYALPGSTVHQAGSVQTMDRILLHQLRFSPPDAGAESLNVADEFHESLFTNPLSRIHLRKTAKPNRKLTKPPNKTSPYKAVSSPSRRRNQAVGEKITSKKPSAKPQAARPASQPTKTPPIQTESQPSSQTADQAVGERITSKKPSAKPQAARPSSQPTKTSPIQTKNRQPPYFRALPSLKALPTLAPRGR